MSFVLLPEDTNAWIANAQSAGAMLIWLAAVAVALMALAKVNVEKLPFGKAIMRVWRRNVTVPRAERRQRSVASAITPLIENMRVENNAHHDSNRERLSGIELGMNSVKGELQSVTGRLDLVETALHHSVNGDETSKATAQTKETT